MGQQQTGRKRWAWGVAAAVAVLIAGCGGGSDTSAVRVVGDSLSDSGTFGYRFTVQGTEAQPNGVWTERVAQAVGVGPLCARYSGSATSFPALNPAAARCTSYGVGGAEVNPVGTARDATPLSVVQQLTDAAAAGAYAGDELLLVDGGGNDAASLVGAFLGASSDGGAAYAALLGELLTPAQVGAAAAAGQAGLVAAGGLYMTAVADQLADAIRTQALDKGAQRVVVLNAPNINLTPRFKNVLAGVAAVAGADTAAGVSLASDAWVKAFNARLASRFASDSRVVVVDFYSALDGWVKQPANHGLTNTSTPACPAVRVENGLPAYSIQTCTAASLSANPPAGVTDPNWWQTYFFSDHFHGTPRANQLMAHLVLNQIRQKGWD